MYGLGPLRGIVLHLRGHAWVVSAVHKGWGDVTKCCQNYDELCSSMENSENCGKSKTVFSIQFTNK